MERKQFILLLEQKWQKCHHQHNYCFSFLLYSKSDLSLRGKLLLWTCRQVNFKGFSIYTLTNDWHFEKWLTVKEKYQGLTFFKLDNVFMNMYFHPHFGITVMYFSDHVSYHSTNWFPTEDQTLMIHQTCAKQCCLQTYKAKTSFLHLRSEKSASSQH